jgi:hypothetical protein
MDKYFLLMEEYRERKRLGQGVKQSGRPGAGGVSPEENGTVLLWTLPMESDGGEEEANPSSINRTVLFKSIF